MKKLLVIAMVSVFAVSAFAVDFSFTGWHEVKGQIWNESESEETSHNIYHDVAIVGKAQLDAKTTFNFRAYMSDGNYGTGLNGDPANKGKSPRGNNHFDRFWMTYELVDGLKLTAGRTALGLSGNTFLQNMWTVTDAQGNPTSDQIRADYKVNNDVALYASYVVRAETDTEIDTTLGFFGANLKFADLKINPVLSFLTDSKAKQGRQLAFGVAASYLPASGIQVEGGVAMNKQLADGVYTGDEKPMVFGVYADVAFVMDNMKVGGLVAFSSADEDAAVGYKFSKNWDKTFMIDDAFVASDGGFSGFLQVAAYADFDVMSDLTLSTIVAYYMNMADNGKKGGMILDQDTLDEDATIIDLEVSAAYKLSSMTTLSAGIGYAMISDLTAASDDYDFIGAYWSLKTVF